MPFLKLRAAAQEAPDGPVGAQGLELEVMAWATVEACPPPGPPPFPSPSSPHYNIVKTSHARIMSE